MLSASLNKTFPSSSFFLTLQGVLTTECRYDMNEVRCRITDTLMAGVEFFRPDGVKVAFCNRNSTHCEYIDGFSRDYVVTPAPDVVVLVMKNVNISVDVGSWACRDGRYGELSTCANSFMGMIRLRRAGVSLNIHSFRLRIAGPRPYSHI